MIVIPDDEASIDQPYKTEADLAAEEEQAQLEELKKSANDFLFEKVGVKFETAPYDPRFPHMNQTKHCWQNYIDYQKCVRAKGDAYQPCSYFKWIYGIMCPTHWVV